MVMPDGTVKVTDFGIARAVGGTAMTAVGNVSGTPQYMSPEQATGGTATPLSDIYSLGAVAYEMLVGHPPFAGDNSLAITMAHVHQAPPELPDSIPADVRSLVMRALAKDPVQRPPTAAVFADDARQAQQRLTSSAEFAPTVSTEAAASTALSPEVADPATSVMPPSLVKQSGRPSVLGGDFVRQARKRGRVIAYAAAAVLAVIVGLVLWNVTSNDDNIAASASDSTPVATTPPTPATTVAPTTGSPASSTATAAAPTVLVDANALIGLNKKDATKRLVALGFVVKEKDSKGHGNVPKDTVVAVEPNGQVAPGSTITIEVSGKK
jgi:eukaryotic-like serine/threonine-protein kinase